MRFAFEAFIRQSRYAIKRKMNAPPKKELAVEPKIPKELLNQLITRGEFEKICWTLKKAERSSGQDTFPYACASEAGATYSKSTAFLSLQIMGFTSPTKPPHGACPGGPVMTPNLCTPCRAFSTTRPTERRQDPQAVSRNAEGSAIPDDFTTRIKHSDKQGGPDR
jgi:hypothetical protein